MPLNEKMQQIKDSMVQKHGPEKGEQIFYSWLSKHGLDDTKSPSDQKGKMHETAIACPECETVRAFLASVEPQPQADHVPDSKPGDFPPQPRYEEMEKNEKEDVTASKPTFNFPTIQFNASFTAGAEGELSDGSIPLIGDLVSQTDADNSQGWRIGKRGNEAKEFASIANQIISAAKSGRPIQVRLDHEGSTDKVVGGFYDATASSSEGLWRLTTKAYVNPKDPQIRENIFKGWIRDYSIGLDAEGHCDTCDTPLKPIKGADGKDVLTFACEHLDSKVYFANASMKEGSMVVEPAFKGSNFRVGFSEAVKNILPLRSLNSSAPNKEVEVKIMSNSPSTPTPVPVEASAKEKPEMSYADAEKLLKVLGKSAGGRAMMKAMAEEAEGGKEKEVQAKDGDKPVPTDKEDEEEAKAVAKPTASPQASAPKPLVSKTSEPTTPAPVESKFWQRMNASQKDPVTDILWAHFTKQKPAYHAGDKAD